MNRDLHERQAAARAGRFMPRIGARAWVLRRGALTVALLLAGCARESAFAPWLDGEMARADVEPSEWSVEAERAARGLEASEGLATTPTDVAFELPAGAGVEEYVRLALERNPRITAARHRAAAARETIGSATALPDPRAEVSFIGEMAETAAGMVGTMGGLSQEFPFPGKQEARGRIAAQDAAMALAELQRVRLEVEAQARRAYWSLYTADRAIETLEANRALVELMAENARARYEAGQGRQPDVLSASVAVGRVQSDLLEWRQRRASAAAMLNSLLDRAADAELAVTSAVELSTRERSLEELLAAAERGNPELRAIRERIEQQRQRVRLARLERFPDPMVSANYAWVDDEGMSAMANGEDQWWIGFGFNVPIWFEKYEAMEREALEGMLAATADLDASHNAIAFRLQEALSELQAQRELAALFGERLVPEARQAVEASLAAYRAGTADYDEMLRNWERLLELELMHHRAVARHEQVWGDVQELVGEGLSAIASSEPGGETP